MKSIVFATLLSFLSLPTFANVKVDTSEKILISANNLYVQSQSGESAKIVHNCDLKFNQDSKPIIKNNGKLVRKNSTLTIIIDGNAKSCKIQEIAYV